MSGAVCTRCDGDDVPTHMYICTSLHATPVHKKCIAEFAKCSICVERIIGIVRRAVVGEEVKELPSLSETTLKQARRFYKAWHLERLHARRKNEQFSIPTEPDLGESKFFYSSAFGCLDWIEITPEKKETHTANWAKKYDGVNRAWREHKAKIKAWFKYQTFDSPDSCDLCLYLHRGGELEYKDVSPMLPSTSCPYCAVGLCQPCLSQLYSPEKWRVLLRYGTPEGKMPSLVMKCSAKGCPVDFCKYRLFEDADQKFELHLNGPHGPTPISESCLMLGLRGDYDIGSLTCEIEGCVDLGFCSSECKKSHCRYCKDCQEWFHVTESTKKNRCLNCQTERDKDQEEEEQTNNSAHPDQGVQVTF